MKNETDYKMHDSKKKKKKEKKPNKLLHQHVEW